MTTTTEFEIRPRQGSDIAALVRILRRCHEADSFPEVWPTDPERWLAPRREFAAIVAVAHTTGVVVGHLGLHRVGDHPLAPAWRLSGAPSDRSAILSRLIVDPDFRRAGCATRLLIDAQDALGSHGVTPVLDVAVANRGARALYRNLGWIELGVPTVTRRWQIPVVAMTRPPTGLPPIG